jgi:hypothetical protein
MLVDYIKNIIDGGVWDVELTDGKYIVKQIVDCKDNEEAFYILNHINITIINGVKYELKKYLPEGIIYEVKIELINVPKLKINCNTEEDLLKSMIGQVNIHRTYGIHRRFGPMTINNPQQPVIITRRQID